MPWHPLAVLRALLIIQIVAAVIGPLALAALLKEHLRATWRSWWWGAAALVVSQVARIPLALAVSDASGPPDLEDAPLWIVAFLVLSSALFEEMARWIVIRARLRAPLLTRDAVMLGAGHGGMESILVAGFGGATALFALATGDPEGLLRNVRSWYPLLAIWDRALAIAFHMCASVIVMRGVRGADARWLLLAIALHAGINGAVVSTVRASGPLPAEVVATALLALPVLIARKAAALRAPTEPT